LKKTATTSFLTYSQPMPSPFNSELLVVLADDDVDRVRSSIESNYRVLHSVSPRVLVIQKPASNLTSPTHLAGVLLATDDDVPEEMLSTLNPTEKQWVQAWLLRKRPKQRVGDGLSWDAPGFLPPDRPEN
jgi:hypothetical protein